ncbi:MAG: hypothetical protein ACE5PO_04035 [Candidatus Bathyarchaeia archaeon]
MTQTLGDTPTLKAAVTIDCRIQPTLCGDTPVMRILDSLQKASAGTVVEVVYDELEHEESILLWANKTGRKVVFHQPLEHSWGKVCIEKT